MATAIPPEDAETVVTRSQGCCDGFDSTSCAGNDLCDSYFNYCLRAIGSTGRGCSYFGDQSSDPNTDDYPLDFSQDIVLGLENPITLQGLVDTYTVNFSRLICQYGLSH